MELMVGQVVVVANGEVLAEEILKVEFLGDADLATADSLAILDEAVAVDNGLGPCIEAGIVIQKSGYREDSLPFQVVDVQIDAGTDGNVQDVVRGRTCLVLEVAVLEAQ